MTTLEEKCAEYLAWLSQSEDEYNSDWQLDPEGYARDATREAAEAFKSVFLPNMIAAESAASEQNAQDKRDYLVDRYGERYAATVLITATSLEPEWSNHYKAEMRKPSEERDWNRGKR